MTAPGADSPLDEERLREEAAAWFARLRAPDGEASRAAFVAWRDEDPAHAAAYARLERVWTQGAVLTGRATAGGGSTAAAPRRLQIRWVFGAAGLGAAALAALAILAAPPSLRLDAASWVWPRVSTQPGEVRSLRLTDGTWVTLDSGTVLSTHITADLRQVRLVRGRVRFDVAGGAPPFVVDAGRSAIETHGALFDVTAPAGRSASAIVLGGRLDARDLDASSKPPIRRWAIAAGQRMAVDAGTGAFEVAQAPADDLLWPQGLLDFHGATLDDALIDANRYSPPRIVLASPTLAALKISGVFKAHANAELAASLAAMFHLSLSRDDAGDYVLAPSDKP